MKECIIRKTTGETPDFSKAESLAINEFFGDYSKWKPEAKVQILYSDKGLHVRFTVKDRYVVCRASKYLDCVCKDSCAEFFLEPPGGKGYTNFEFSANGTLLSQHLIDWTRTETGFANFHNMPEETDELVIRKTSLHGIIDPEIAEDVTWTLEAFIPFAIFEKEYGIPAPKAGDVWRGNFYTCADDSSHQRWASWNPITALNFHMPPCFGALRFGE